MVHSVGRGEGLFPETTRHRPGDRGVVLEGRELVSPRVLSLERFAPIGAHVLHACARVLAGAKVLHAATGARGWARGPEVGQQRRRRRGGMAHQSWTARA